MSKIVSLGQYLLNSTLPKEHQGFNGPVDSKMLSRVLVPLAKQNPMQYKDSVTMLRDAGDEFATLEGVSVGLEDITPVYKDRDPIMRAGLAAFHKADTKEGKLEALVDTQKKLKVMTGSHPGDLGLQARSGSRGNVSQLMKSVASPIAVTNSDGDIVPWFIRNSYSEGITPAESWIAGDEARRSVIEGKTEVTVPGTVGKLLLGTMYDQVVSTVDCGTYNGIPTPTANKRDLVDRYIARDLGPYKHNTLITSDVLTGIEKAGKTVVVRSPMTCAISHGGACQKCMGLNEKGQPHTIGTNVGVRSAQGMSEPLAQMTLSAKHGAKLAVGKGPVPGGVEAVQMLLNIPKTFIGAATVSQIDGKVGTIHAAPQGGFFVHVNDTQHYVPPGVDVSVKSGHTVEAGDVLSTGIPRPDDIVQHKGMGAGRKYLVDQLISVYNNAGIDLDKRHLELLAKADLNHVRIDHDPKDEFVRGDTVHMNRIRSRLLEDADTTKLDKAEGHILADDYLYFSAGTRVTPSVVTVLREHKIDAVKTAHEPPKFTFIMKPIAQVPLLGENWLSRMSHNHLKDSIIEGATNAYGADLHGYHPIPGYVYGLEFGDHEGGKY